MRKSKTINYMEQVTCFGYIVKKENVNTLDYVELDKYINEMDGYIKNSTNEGFKDITVEIEDVDNKELKERIVGLFEEGTTTVPIKEYKKESFDGYIIGERRVNLSVRYDIERVSYSGELHYIPEKTDYVDCYNVSFGYNKTRLVPKTRVTFF